MRSVLCIALLFNQLYLGMASDGLCQSKSIGYSNTDAAYAKGLELKNRGEYRAALALLTTALRDEPNDYRLYELQGDLFWHLSDSINAMNAYTKAIKRDTLRSTAYEKRAGIHYRRQEWGDAVADLSAVIRIKPEAPIGYFYRGLSFMELDRFHDGQSDFKAAYDRGMIMPSAYYLAVILGTCPDAAIRNGSRAIEYARVACTCTGFKEYKELSILAASYAEAGQWDEAVGRSKKALELAEGQNRPTERMRCELYQSHQPNRFFSLKYIKSHTALSPGELILFAQVKGDAGDHMGAIADLRKAIELNPHLSYAYVELSSISSPEKSTERIDLLGRALEVNPKCVDALALRAKLYLSLNKYRESLEDSQACLRLDPKLTDARWTHVLALAGSGEFPQAFAELKELSQKYPNAPRLRTAWGHCYLLQKRYDEAISEFTESIRRDPGDSWAYSDRAVALSALNKDAEAIKDLEACCRLVPALRSKTEERMRSVRKSSSRP